MRKIVTAAIAALAITMPTLANACPVGQTPTFTGGCLVNGLYLVQQQGNQSNAAQAAQIAAAQQQQQLMQAQTLRNYQANSQALIFQQQQAAAAARAAATHRGNSLFNQYARQ